ncbi:hypothetical protein [Aeromonas sp. BIGb0445]|uniref:hypothetical protein n=1 Tax=Aeromonas sp. BIGb0445 TaxID=2940593 RepID=UPI00216923A9|nr:hypothetical protein [Aeromonas sp. BIGb0445]MCS3458590.1 hypothetical protein [Aeromonas sp. BIGb0445]
MKMMVKGCSSRNYYRRNYRCIPHRNFGFYNDKQDRQPLPQLNYVPELVLYI